VAAPEQAVGASGLAQRQEAKVESRVGLHNGGGGGAGWRGLQSRSMPYNHPHLGAATASSKGGSPPLTSYICAPALAPQFGQSLPRPKGLVRLEVPHTKIMGMKPIE